MAISVYGGCSNILVVMNNRCIDTRDDAWRRER
jgi:hypothetical protein